MDLCGSNSLVNSSEEGKKWQANSQVCDSPNFLTEILTALLKIQKLFIYFYYKITNKSCK